MDKRKEKAIEELRKKVCHYPIMDEKTGEMKPCGEKQMMSVSLPIINYTESGEPVSDQDRDTQIQIPFPLCNYHAMLSMATGMFSMKSDAKMDKCQLVAPFDAIHITERVIDVMILTGKLQERIKQQEQINKEVIENIKKAETQTQAKS